MYVTAYLHANTIQTNDNIWMEFKIIVKNYKSLSQKPYKPNGKVMSNCWFLFNVYLNIIAVNSITKISAI